MRVQTQCDAASKPGEMLRLHDIHWRIKFDGHIKVLPVRGLFDGEDFALEGLIEIMTGNRAADRELNRFL